MKKTVDVETDPLEAERQALEEAQAELAALEAEEGAIPARLRGAAGASDADAVLRIRRRLDDLADHKFAARIRILRASIALQERQQEIREAEVPALVEEVARARAEVDRAQQACLQAEDAAAHNRSGRYDGNIRLGELRRELAQLLAEAGRNRGPALRGAFLAKQAAS